VHQPYSGQLERLPLVTGPGGIWVDGARACIRRRVRPALGRPGRGLAITAVICHVGYEVTADVVRRLAGGVDPTVITTAESAAGSVPGVLHADARARWTGRTLRVEIEGWVDLGLPARDADAIGRQVAATLAWRLPQAGSLTWASRAGPS
jgi:hypothetical protein